MNMLLTKAPVREPVSLCEIKSVLGHSSSKNDMLISCLLAAARIVCEARTGLALLTQDWTITFDDVPPERELDLPLAPVHRINGVRIAHGYCDCKRADARQVRLVSDGGTQRLLVEEALVPQDDAADVTLEVDVTAGLADRPEDLPQGLKQAIADLAVHWFTHREPVGFGDPDVPIPDTIAEDFAAFAVGS